MLTHTHGNATNSNANPATTSSIQPTTATRNRKDTQNVTANPTAGSHHAPGGGLEPHIFHNMPEHKHGFAHTSHDGNTQAGTSRREGAGDGGAPAVRAGSARIHCARVMSHALSKRVHKHTHGREGDVFRAQSRRSHASTCTDAQARGS